MIVYKSLCVNSQDLVNFNPVNSTSLPTAQHINNYEFVIFSSLTTKYTNDSITYEYYIDVNAYGKTFKLQLKTDTTIFVNDLQLAFDNDRNIDSYDRLRTVVGNVADDGNSYVYGYVHVNDTFQGVFYYKRTVYYVDYARLYLNNWNNSSEFIIYRDTDIGSSINENSRDKRSIQSSEDITQIVNTNKYAHIRHKRSSQRSLEQILNDNHTTCLVRIDFDTTFLLRYGSYLYGVADIVVLMQRINQVYRHADFDNDGIADGIGFRIQHISFVNARKSQQLTNPVQFFNNLTTTYNYSEYCLALYLTGNLFDDGVLGMANSGFEVDQGICTKSYYYDGINAASSNVAVVSINHKGNVVPFTVREVSIGHEIGHLFGAQHDVKGSSCAPGGTEGNFLMYQDIVNGNQKNNFHFSSCSKQDIRKNLLAKAIKLQNCLVERNYPICGNKIVDVGEECDCGYYDVCKNACCYAAYQYQIDMPTNNYVPCRKNPSPTCGTPVVPIEAIGLSVTFGLPVTLIISVWIFKHIKQKVSRPAEAENVGISRSSQSDWRHTKVTDGH